jgi:ABC-type polysaccharide/polyol phosphate export permease
MFQRGYLLLLLSVFDFKSRYTGSILGYFWSLLKPFLLFLILYFVFSGFGNFDIENYALYLLMGVIIWNFFTESTNAGLNSLVAKSGLIKKIYFPRIFVVLSSVFSAVITLILNLIIFLSVAGLAGVDIDIKVLYLLYAVVLLAIFSIATSMLLALLQSKFRDTVQVWEVVLSAGFFLTPIFYPLDIIKSKFEFILNYNPLAFLISLARYPFFSNQELNFSLGMFSIFSLLYLIGAVLIFISCESKVIEEL